MSTDTASVDKISKYESILQATFVYAYDFGDGWDHKVDSAKVMPVDSGVTYPRCINGKGACPPEDGGGVWGYADLLEVPCRS
jgi:hypothetical protein